MIVVGLDETCIARRYIMSFQGKNPLQQIHDDLLVSVIMHDRTTISLFMITLTPALRDTDGDGSHELSLRPAGSSGHNLHFPEYRGFIS